VSRRAHRQHLRAQIAQDRPPSLARRGVVPGRRRGGTVDWDPEAEDHGYVRAVALSKTLRAQLEEEAARFLEPSRAKTADYLTDWLQRQSGRLKPKTFASYQSCIDRYLIPMIGRIRLTELSPRAVQAVWDSLAESGRIRTARLSRAVLRKALADAVRLGELAFNVVDRTTAPPPVARRRLFRHSRHSVWSAGSPRSLTQHSNTSASASSAGGKPGPNGGAARPWMRTSLPV
jgi:hypothetical protein